MAPPDLECNATGDSRVHAEALRLTRSALTTEVSHCPNFVNAYMMDQMPSKIFTHFKSVKVIIYRGMEGQRLEYLLRQF